MEQSGLHLAPVWDANITGGGLTDCVTVLALECHTLISLSKPCWSAHAGQERSPALSDALI